MDVATLGTFINVDNIILDTEKHHIHDQAYQYQQK